MRQPSWSNIGGAPCRARRERRRVERDRRHRLRGRGEVALRRALRRRLSRSPGTAACRRAGPARTARPAWSAAPARARAAPSTRQVHQHRLRGHVVVPQVVMHGLEDPAHLARGEVQRHHRRRVRSPPPRCACRPTGRAAGCPSARRPGRATRRRWPPTSCWASWPCSVWSAAMGAVASGLAESQFQTSAPVSMSIGADHAGLLPSSTRCRAPCRRRSPGLRVTTTGEVE